MQTYNMKVLYIIILKDKIIQHRLPVDNDLIYTVKSIHPDLLEDDFVKCVITNKTSDFMLPSGEIK